MVRTVLVTAAATLCVTGLFAAAVWKADQRVKHEQAQDRLIELLLHLHGTHKHEREAPPDEESQRESDRRHEAEPFVEAHY